MAVPIFRPTVKRRDMGSVLTCIVSDQLGPGEVSRDLVGRAAHMLGMAGGAVLTSTYLALSVALESLGLSTAEAAAEGTERRAGDAPEGTGRRAGDAPEGTGRRAGDAPEGTERRAGDAPEGVGRRAGDAPGVVLSALAPALYLRVIRDKGLRPLVADVDAESGGIDPQEAARLAETGARAIIVTHSLGIVSDVEALRGIGIPVIEDASQALGGKVGEKPCGSAGDITLVSLDPQHIVTCGGGALLLARSKPGRRGHPPDRGELAPVLPAC